MALADKIDTLVGFFTIGEKPTGSKDPFALRRATLGVIRLIVENGLRLRLSPLFSQADRLCSKLIQAGAATSHDLSDFFSEADLLDFFADRLKVHLKEQGIRHDLVTAVFALGGEDDLVRLLARVAALADFLGSDDGANLLVAYRRAANIVRIEEKKDGVSYAAPIDAGLLRQDEETILAAALAATESDVLAALAGERFAEAMAALARLRRPVDAFFDAVTVNADDPGLRANRLKLLAAIGAAMGRLADFAKVEG